MKFNCDVIIKIKNKKKVKNYKNMLIKMDMIGILKLKNIYVLILNI